MLRSVCCCWSLTDDPSDERQPLLQPTPPQANEAQSSAQSCPVSSGSKSTDDLLLCGRKSLLQPDSSEVNGAPSGAKISPAPSGSKPIEPGQSLLHSKSSEVNGTHSAGQSCPAPSRSESTDDLPVQAGQSSEVNEIESVRQTRPAHKDAQTGKQIGRLMMRRLCVPVWDQRFTVIAEAFNEQQQSYDDMIKHIGNLQQSCNCTLDDPLAFSECLAKIRDEHASTFKMSLKMNGFDFSLCLEPVHSVDVSEGESLPQRLQKVQNEIKLTSESAKSTISKFNILQQLTEWLPDRQDQVLKEVKQAAENYQEQGRLKENLDENIKEVKRANKLSRKYKEEACKVQTEAGKIVDNL
ncbi:uncharacterized protein KZ484_007605 [Pholidichthys leucotaenia]